MDDHSPLHRRVPRKARIGLAAIGLLLAGGAVGAVAIDQTRPSIEMAPMQPVAIARLTESDSPVTVRGRVAEIFGNKYVIDDGSGRALVETGREGEGRVIAPVGQPMTAQGRFERGFLHASFVIGSDGKVIALRPMGPPPGGPHGPGGPGGPHDRRGPPPPPPGDAPSPPPALQGAQAQPAAPAAAPAAVK